MTVIAAVVAGNGSQVHMAADSWAVNNTGLVIDVTKIVTVGAVVAGVAGRVGSIAHVRQAITAHPPTVTTIDRWAERIADAVTAAGVEAGLTEDDGTLEVEILLAWRGRMWELSHHAAIPVQGEYHAVGAGASVALGALHVLADRGGEDRSGWPSVAVGAAARHLAGIGGPTVTATTPSRSQAAKKAVR